jgi:diguanylate cyclase (GGDEF)-like protein
VSDAGLVLGLIAAGAVDLALLAAIAALFLRRPSRRAARARPVVSLTPQDYRTLTALEGDESGPDGVPIAAYDRVVRIAGWTWILSTGLLVLTSGLWPDREGAILPILGIAALFVLIAHDILPAGALGRAKYVVEGGVSIVFVTLIVLLTGGAHSPFFFAFALIVVGAALVVPPAATVALAALAGASYLVAVAIDLPPGGLDVAALDLVGVNLVSLLLLAFVAMVVAREQRRTRQAAVRLSTIDALTGLANRAYILAAIEREIERGTRYGRGFCLLMADLDNLKAVNDSYGHRAGDRVLAQVADIIRDGVRRIDTPSRLGGDEFVVLLPETDPTGAFVVAEKIRQGVAAMRTVERDRPLPVSVSIGLVAWPGDGATLDQLMNSVDGRMYTSKRRGKNRIIGTYFPAGELAHAPGGAWAAGPVVASLAGERLVPISIGERVDRAG